MTWEEMSDDDKEEMYEFLDREVERERKHQESLDELAEIRERIAKRKAFRKTDAMIKYEAIEDAIQNAGIAGVLALIALLIIAWLKS